MKPWTAPGSPEIPRIRPSRHTRNRLRIEHAFPDDAEPARAFGHEHVAVGQKRDGPGEGQLLRHGDDADPLAFGGVEFDGLFGELLAPEPARGHGNREAGHHLHLLLTESDLRAGGGRQQNTDRADQQSSHTH